MPKPSATARVARIWDRAPHNAFTDLKRFNNRWFCTFREGAGHVSPDGALRIITSDDGATWESAALITRAGVDLRDPKLCITPDNRLMVTGGVATRKGNEPETEFRTMVWFSKDGSTWSDGVEIGEPNMWLWRTTWHKGVAYNAGYSCREPWFVKLYTSRDGTSFEPMREVMCDRDEPNEQDMLFLGDDTAISVVRCEAKSNNAARLGRSKPPYTTWDWQVLNHSLGGPATLRLPDGRFIAAGRIHIEGTHTGLCWLDLKVAKLEEFCRLPSGGDTSYPGLVWHDGELWVSYYASHDVKASIYLARVSL
jgi:hypothetical protein